jgi:hypothetical protein
METILTHVKKRIFFQLEIDADFKKRLNDLAILNGIKASGVIRMLVNREHSALFNGHQPPITDPGCQDEKEKQ